MALSDSTQKAPYPKGPVTTYQEKKIGATLYRVTSVYRGDIDLGKALEDLTVRKILALEGSSAQV